MTPLADVAARINAHLKRLEQAGLCRLYNAGAYYMGGARIRVTYASHEGGTTMSRTKAEAYLSWLDAGHAGRHGEHVSPNRSASTQKLDGGGA